MKHLMLIDGSGYVFRAFYGYPAMTNPAGTPIQAVYGFCTMVGKLVFASEADAVAIVFDAGRSSFRNALYPEYKANRAAPPEALIPQFPLVRAAAKAFNVASVELENYEADDLIASYAHLAAEQGINVEIVSSDKDLMQLVGGRISMLDPMKNLQIGPVQVKEKFGVPPEQMIDLQALAGDSSDNIPGVPGIGVKTAAELLREFGSVRELLARLGEIKQARRRALLQEHAEDALIGYKLASLRRDAPLPYALEQFRRQKPEPEILRQFLEQQGFKSLIARYSSLLADSASVPQRPLLPPIQSIQTGAQLQAWVGLAQKARAIFIKANPPHGEKPSEMACALMAPEGGAITHPIHIRCADGAHQKMPQKISDKQDSLADSVKHRAENHEGLNWEESVRRLAPVLESPYVLKIGHNIKNEARMFRHYGIKLAPVDDVMLLSFTLDAGLHKHELQTLVSRHLNEEPKPSSDTSPSRLSVSGVGWDTLVHLAQLWEVFTARLVSERKKTLYETIERPLIAVIAEMESHGITVNPAVLEELSRQFALDIEKSAEAIYQHAGQEFNIASPAQLAKILFGVLQLPAGKKTKTGQAATDSKTLEFIAEENPPARGIIETILEYRHFSKLRSTYTEALKEQIHPQTRRVHTNFAMAGAQTGRLASNDPNLQNIPVRSAAGKHIRKAFVAPAGWVLVSLDYSQIELRLLAFMAEIAPMQRAFRQKQDVHAHTAGQLFERAPECVTAEQRYQAKAINFGIIYGISAFGLARQLGCTQRQAKEFIAHYHKQYPGISRFMERKKKECSENGYVETCFGRRIHLPGIRDKTHALRQYAERQAINAPVQGSAADIIKRAMVRIPQIVRYAGLQAKLLLQVHDELLFEIPKHQSEQSIPILKSVMEKANLPEVPIEPGLVVDAKTGLNWAELRKL